MDTNTEQQASLSLNIASVTSLAPEASKQNEVNQDAVAESQTPCISAPNSGVDTSGVSSESRVGAATPPEVPSSSTSLDSTVIVKQERIKTEDEGCGSFYSQIEEFISSTESGYEHCEFHSAELLEKNMVCMICKKLICGLCLAQKHMGHHILSINKIRETKNIRDSLNGDLSRLQSLQQNLTERFKERRLLRDSIKQSANTLLNNIDKAFQQLQDILENKHQEVVNHVKRFERSNVEEVTKNLEVIKSLEQLATKTIISVEKFFDRLDVQSASLLPERLKEVLEHVNKNHFVPIENKEKYLPAIKFAKFISSIEAVSSICKTIHPEASKVVWSKVTPDNKGMKSKQSPSQTDQQANEDKKEDIKGKVMEHSDDSSKGKRKLEDSAEGSSFKKPRTEISPSLSPNISSTVSSEGETSEPQTAKENPKQGKTRVIDSVFERMLTSTQEWKESLDSNVVGHSTSDEESDSTDATLPSESPKKSRNKKTRTSKNSTSSPSSALRETRSTASPLKIKTETLDQSESGQQQTGTEDVGVDPYRYTDTSETEDEEDDIPSLKHVKFNLQKMPNECCVLVKGPDKAPWLGKVTNISRVKETMHFVVHWIKGKIGDKKFHISDKWQKKGDKMSIDCAIAYFDFDLDEEMSDELIEELKTAQNQGTFSERKKTKILKEKRKESGSTSGKSRTPIRTSSKSVLKPALTSPLATSMTSTSQSNSNKKSSSSSRKSSSSSTSSKSKSSPSPANAKSGKSKKSGKS